MTTNVATKQVKDDSNAVVDTASGYKEKAGEIARQGLDKANQLGTKVADTISSSSEYIRNVDVAEATEKVRTAVKQKPEVTIAVAALFGLIIGLLIGRKR